MSSFEVESPILNSPFDPPIKHWYLKEGESPKARESRRPPIVFSPRDQAATWDLSDGTMATSKEYGGYELTIVNAVRRQVAEWRKQGYPGVTGTTLDLLRYWQRDGREKRLFFAQLEAAESIIFLKEARKDFLQGISVPLERLPESLKEQGYEGFQRYACKMATGSGKSTLMAMLSAWSILNKVNYRADSRFSDVVLIVCPNVTIRNRLQELDPSSGEASVYRTRDLVPTHLMANLAQGRIVITNWHVFEPQSVNVVGISAKVTKLGVPVKIRETITIGQKTTTARGTRYLTLLDYQNQVAGGLLNVIEEENDSEGNLKKVKVESLRYVESDTALINRVIGREIGAKENILVFNDEAHHAYRILRDSDELQELETDEAEEEEDTEEFYKEATIWVDGLDKVNRLRKINFCVDVSATPYFLGRVGKHANRPFPWIVSDFGLIEAIESGLVKIPQMAVRDSTGDSIPGYFNIWDWIMGKLTTSEKGGKGRSPKPEAILKYAHTPIAMLAGLWEKEVESWKTDKREARPPVFILVCKNTRIAKVIFEWLAEKKNPPGIPAAKIAGFLNTSEKVNTIRVDSKVVHDTDTGAGKQDENKWMRATLDTVGRIHWPTDRQGRPIYPEGFEALASKLGRPLHPPGRDVRCIVSVGMLTEGWDCNTVTHIVGLRPFMSQLLCEQVVGRGLRRASYELGADGRFNEEVAKVFGVPFEVIPFKANPGSPAPKEKRHRVHAIPERSFFEIRFPRVEGFSHVIRNKITIHWESVPKLTIQPNKIPPEVEVKGVAYTNKGKLSLSGPGRIDDVTLQDFRAKRRIQELVFDLASGLTSEYVKQPSCTIPPHTLFPQVTKIVERYIREKVEVLPPADLKDLFLAPYYGWLIEILVQAIQPDVGQGEAPEVPRYEKNRGMGSTAEVDFWTSKPVYEVRNSHLNYVVADTLKWEQTAAFLIDRHPLVAAFVKNQGLGFSIPYVFNGETHEYVPDFIIRLKGKLPFHVILETKGYDEREDFKKAAADRWVKAVNQEGSYGQWAFLLVKKISDIPVLLEKFREVPEAA